MFFSNTRRSNLTIKADLIYEEYVGIDLHHTLHVTNESNIDATTKNGSKKTSFPHPEGLSIVEDDDGSLLPVTLEEKNKSNEATTSMPTFELLDEESEEDLPANYVEENECKIIDEKTVFDHIRRKAKDFPVLSTSDAINCPSPEATKLTKKRIHEMRLEFHGMVEVSERSGRNTKPRQFKVPSYLASTDADQSERLIDEKVTKQHMATGSLDIVKLVDDEVFSSVMPPGVNEDTTGSSSRFPDMPPQVNEDATRSSVIIPVMPQVNEDATGSSSRISSRKMDSIFDRLRRKTRNLPIMNKSETTQIKYDPLITDHSPDNKFETSNLGSRKVNAAAPSNKTPSDTVTILDLEPSETEDGASVSLDGYTENHSLSSRRSTGVRRTLDLPFLSNASDSLHHHKSVPTLSPTKDIPSKPAEQSVEPRSAIHDQSLSGGVIGQSSAPTKTADESNKKVDSFLGFKSIFSFL